MESILTSIKNLLGITEEYEHFDQSIIMHINSTFSILKKIGVGPSTGFSISDKYAVWTEFLSEEDENFHDVKSYMHAKVKLLWDPPANASHLQALKETIKEFEWRMNFTADIPVEEEVSEDGQ